jgi:hypothetical protein
MYTNDQITSFLKYADISTYLSLNEYEVEKYYNWVDETKRTRLLYIVKENLEYYQGYYNQNNSYQNAIIYMYSLMGKWISQSITISGNPNGTIVGGSVVLPGTFYGGTIAKSYTAFGSESSISFSDMIGKSCLQATRGGLAIPNIITYGTPTGNDAKWNISTGTLSFAIPLAANENVTALFN